MVETSGGGGDGGNFGSHVVPQEAARGAGAGVGPGAWWGAVKSNIGGVGVGRPVNGGGGGPMGGPTGGRGVAMQHPPQMVEVRGGEVRGWWGREV